MSEGMSIREYLGRLVGEPVYYCPNPGNAGDSAIAAATFQLFEEVGVRYHLVRWDEHVDLTGQVVIYGGGGNLIPLYVHGRTFIERHHRGARRLIVLPHTVAGHDDLLAQLGTNVEIVCRERRSYDHVRRRAPRVNASLMHDMVFYLDPVRILEGDHATLPRLVLISAARQLRYGRFINRSKLVRSAFSSLRSRARFALSNSLTRNHDRKILNSFRGDAEQSAMDLPPRNIDVSAVFQLGTHTPELAFAVTRSVLRFLSRFEEINTNRLHVCMLSALLGKKVNFYPNSYFKCEAVYDYSIRDRFPNVRWVSGLRSAAKT